MVVVLIIAILLAIAIPTFLGARTRAQDRAAQSTLRLALTTEKIYYVDNNVYTTVSASLTAIEPTLTYVASATPTAPSGTLTNKVGVSTDAATGTIICLTATSASGSVWAMADESVGSGAGTYYFSPTLRLTTCDTTVSSGTSHF